MRLIVYLLMLVTVSIAASGQNTTRSKLRLRQQASHNVTDTVAASRGDVTFSGYDKIQSAKYESVFVTNNTGYSISGIKMTLEYYDKGGRKIHTREWTAKCNLAPGETCVIDIKAWDKQGAWYYKDTHSRINKKGSPYDVKIRADYLIIKS